MTAETAVQRATLIHTVIRTRLGQLTIVRDTGALTGLYFPRHWPRPDPATFGARTSRGFEEVTRQLDEYLAAERSEFACPSGPGAPVPAPVWDLITQVPYGRTTSYGELARRVGGREPSAVGAAVGQNPLCILIPCHRVIGSTGKLTGYAGGLGRKRALLDMDSRGQPQLRQVGAARACGRRARAPAPGPSTSRARPGPGPAGRGWREGQGAAASGGHVGLTKSGGGASANMTGKQPFEAVVTAHGATVLRVCRAVLRPADADDAWSETFLSAMKAYPDLPDDWPDARRGWSPSPTARPSTLPAPRAAAPVPLPEGLDIAAAGTAHGPASSLDSELADAVGRPPAKQKQAVAYHYLAGLPYAEVAAILGGTADAARRAAADGIATLRRTYPGAAQRPAP